MRQVHAHAEQKMDHIESRLVGGAGADPRCGGQAEAVSALERAERVAGHVWVAAIRQHHLLVLGHEEPAQLVSRHSLAVGT